MVVVADASVAIRGDLSGFHNDLKGAQRETMTLGQRLNDILTPKNLLKGAAVFGLATTLPGAIRDLAGFAGQAASNFRELEQTGRTIDTVFGDSASTIEDWADRAADAAGMSKREVQASASQMGATLINMGVDAGTAADLVVQAQQRAADLAVSQGRDVQDALLGLSALLRGEFDTIEKFGVRIKQVDVNARIAALGLDVSTDAAKRQSEAIATMTLFMEQSEFAMGRFADGAEDTAIKMEKSGAKWENFVDTVIGPAANSEMDKMANDAASFVESIEGVLDFFDQTDDPRFAQLGQSLGISARDARDQVFAAMDETGQSFDTTIDGMLDSAYVLGEEGAASFDHFTAAFTQMGQNVQGVASGVGDVVAFAIPAAVLAHWDSIKQAGIDTMTAYQQGIFENQDDLMSEIDALLKNLDERMEPGEEIAYLRGKKIELFMALGIAEEKGDLGAVAAIRALIDKINAQLNGLNGYEYGKNLALTMSQGIKDYTESARISAYALGGIIRSGVGINSEPEDHNSPLYGITKWGGNIVKTIAEGITGELGTGQAAARALAGALVPSLGGAMGMAGTGQAVIGAGSTYVLHVNGVQYQVGTAEEAIETLQELGVFGEGRVN